MKHDIRCAVCGQFQETTQRLYETQRKLARATLRGDEYERGLKEIIRVLVEEQPRPRNASVTYVAGYARAMDDMKRAILEAVERTERYRQETPLTATLTATLPSHRVPDGPGKYLEMTSDRDEAGQDETPGGDF